MGTVTKKVENLTVGSDPELFLKEVGSDKFISAIGLIGGSKKKPKPITTEGHFIQEDNVAAEFNIPACKSAEELVKHITFVMNYIKDTVCKDNNLEISTAPSAIFTPDQLLDKKALVFGCDPDMNAWTGEENYIDRENIDPYLRSCGGHIHIGYDDPSTKLSLELVKAIDLFISVPSVLLDNDDRRRELYGKAGAYRLKKFGVEVRTPSNFWIHDVKLIKWVYNQILAAVEFVNSGGVQMITNPEQIVEAINTNNKTLAREIIDDYNIVMPEEEIQQTAVAREE